MKKVLRLAVLLAALFFLMLPAGCSSDFSRISVDTVMTVDRSFNGSRVMTAQIPASIYSRVFGGDIQNIENIISANVPDSMNCTASETGLGGASVNATMEFSSLSEYQDEVSKICALNTGDGRVTPSVTFDHSQSVLKNGYSLDENFSSVDLLFWLSDALVTEYPQLESSADTGIFKTGNTSLNLNGKSIEIGGTGRIQASDIESHTFDGINIETTVNSDNTIDGNIRYSVSSQVVSYLGDRLDSLMNELVPQNGAITDSDSDSGARTYRIKFTSSSEQAYVTAMNRALAVNDTVFSVSTEGEQDSLSVRYTYNMFFDGKYFLDFNDPDTSFSYVLRVPSNFSVESCTGTYGYLSGSDSTYSSNVCEITMNMPQPDRVAVVLGYVVDIDSISVDTYIHSEINIDRSITFRLTSDADALIGSSIREQLETVHKRWPDNITVSSDKGISSVEYSVRLKSSSFDEVTQMTRAVLQENTDSSQDADYDGQPEDSRLSGGTVAPRQPIYKHYQVSDIINFSKFLKGARLTEGIQYKLTYPKYYTASFSGNTSFENAQTDGQSITCSSYNRIISVPSAAVKVNIEGICVLVMWILSLAICIVFVFIEFTHILVFFRDRKLDVDGAALFKGRNMFKLTLFSAALVCFVIMSVRIIFCIY